MKEWKLSIFNIVDKRIKGDGNPDDKYVLYERAL